MTEEKKRNKTKRDGGYDFEFDNDEIAEILTEKLQEEGEDIPREEVDVELSPGHKRSTVRVRGKGHKRT